MTGYRTGVRWCGMRLPALLRSALSPASRGACWPAWARGRRAAAAQGGASPIDKPQVAVVRLTFTGGVAEAARELFAQRLVEGLAVAEFQVTSGPPVAERLSDVRIDPHVVRGRGLLSPGGAGARRRVPGRGRRR